MMKKVTSSDFYVTYIWIDHWVDQIRVLDESQYTWDSMHSFKYIVGMVDTQGTNTAPGHHFPTHRAHDIHVNPLLSRSFRCLAVWVVSKIVI